MQFSSSSLIVVSITKSKIHCCSAIFSEYLMSFTERTSFFCPTSVIHSSETCFFFFKPIMFGNRYQVVSFTSCSIPLRLVFRRWIYVLSSFTSFPVCLYKEVSIFPFHAILLYFSLGCVWSVSFQYT